LTTPTPAEQWNSVCVASDGSYDTKEGLITSFPVRSDGEKWEIVQNVPINEFARGKLDASVTELDEERSLVSSLLPSE
jgi:malate dehydrogenase